MFTSEDSDEADVHLCIRCRQSFEGLENYIEHRKKGCLKQRQTKPNRCLGDNEAASGSIVIENQDEPDFEKNKVQRHQVFQMGDSQDHDFGKTPLQADLLDSIMCEKHVVNKSESETFNFHKHEGSSASFSFHDSRSNASKYFKSSVAKDLTPTSSTSGEVFSKLYDPIFTNDPSVTSLFKSFDNLPENHKMPESHLLFPQKDNSGSYYLEPSTFEQRYF